MKVLFTSMVLLTLLSCGQAKSITHSESLSKENGTVQDTAQVPNYDQLFQEEYEIMSKWTEEEKRYFYENFVYSSEELEEKLGIKLPKESTSNSRSCRFSKRKNKRKN